MTPETKTQRARELMDRALFDLDLAYAVFEANDARPHKSLLGALLDGELSPQRLSPENWVREAYPVIVHAEAYFKDSAWAEKRLPNLLAPAPKGLDRPLSIRENTMRGKDFAKDLQGHATTYHRQLSLWDLTKQTSPHRPENDKKAAPDAKALPAPHG